MFKTLSIIVALGIVALGPVAGCAGRNPPGPDQQAPPTTAEPAAARLTVPQVASLRAADADVALLKAGLIPILRYEPGILSGSGTVVNTDPPVGTLLKSGDLITVIIAGAPGNTLQDYVDAHRDLFVGVGVDANDVLVVGVHESANLAAQLDPLAQHAAGRQFRVQSCSRTWAELRRVQVSLSDLELLKQAAYGTSIDPLACAVRLTGDLNDAQVAALTTKFSGALVIQKGEASRTG